MTDQEIIEALRKYIWDYLLWRNRNGYSWSFESLEQVAANDMVHALKGKHWDYWLSLGATHKERREAAKRFVALHNAEITEMIEDLMLKISGKNARDSVNRISASAVLEPMLDESGLPYYIEYQNTGVKIHVKLLPKKKAQLYMSYSRVRKEAGALLSNILILKRMYDYFGIHSGIVNIDNEDEKNFKNS